MPGEPRDAGLLGRETKGKLVLVSRLHAALERFFGWERMEHAAELLKIIGQDHQFLGVNNAIASTVWCIALFPSFWILLHHLYLLR